MSSTCHIKEQQGLENEEKQEMGRDTCLVMKEYLEVWCFLKFKTKKEAKTW